MNQRKSRIVTTCLKYVIAACFCILAACSTNSVGVLTALIELALIAAVTNLLTKKIVIANIVNSIFIFIFNTQMAVLLFSGTFIEPVMLSNLTSIEDISGNAVEYITAVIIILAFSFLPVCEIQIFGLRRRKVFACFFVLLFFEAGILIYVSSAYSPSLNTIFLIQEEYQIAKMRSSIHLASNSQDSSTYADEFYQDKVSDYRAKSSDLPENPNVILIFTEGLSQNVIDDERNIMPNVSAFLQASLQFTGYYNHTFATYRGLIGQLYSGYQLDNLDENCLVSLQGILRDTGYYTCFINTEPNNAEFTAYLNNLDFDDVIGSSDDTLSGEADSYSDKEAYELLYDTALTLSESDAPFFLSIYTFGTHATFGGVDYVYGDGSVNELNKFYNADVCFGNFLEAFEESTLAEDTLIVFTADHATYADAEFSSAFPLYERSFSQIDEIPLCFYYTGITAESIEADGRNSLDLAPTILDYLDISAPNFFLGESLFAEISDSVSLDTIFYSENTAPLSTKYGDIQNITSDEDLSWILSKLQTYFVAKLENVSDEDLKKTESMEQVITILSEDGQTLEITYTPEEDEAYTAYYFPAWSGENGQDDIVWYQAEQTENNEWRVVVPLSDHTLHGQLVINIYGMDEQGNLELIDGLGFLLPEN